MATAQVIVKMSLHEAQIVDDALQVYLATLRKLKGQDSEIRPNADLWRHDLSEGQRLVQLIRNNLGMK